MSSWIMAAQIDKVNASILQYVAIVYVVDNFPPGNSELITSQYFSASSEHVNW